MKLKHKIMIPVIGLIVCISVSIGLSTFKYSKDALLKNSESYMNLIVDDASTYISDHVNGIFKSMHVVGDGESYKNLASNIQWLESTVDIHKFKYMGVADTKGNVLLTTGQYFNIADRDYFKKALAGNDIVSDPIVSKVDDTIVLVYAIPLKVNDSTIDGVIIAVSDIEMLSKVTDRVHIGEPDANSKYPGNVFIISSDATTIAHPDIQKVLKTENVLLDPTYDNTSLERVVTDMMQGNAGFSEYSYDGVDKFVAYKRIDSTAITWSIAIAVTEKYLFEKIEGVKLASIVITLVSIAFGIGLMMIIVSLIEKMIQAIRKDLETISEGDLTSTHHEYLLEKKDETGIIARSMNKMLSNVSHMIKKIMFLSRNQHQRLDAMTLSMKNILLNVELVAESTEHVSATMEQTTASAQEISSITSAIGQSISDMNIKSNETLTMVDQMHDSASSSYDEFTKTKATTLSVYNTTREELVTTLDGLSLIDNISSSVAHITEISNRVNILALNATIEAARAGDAGRGFNVVASEIRELSVVTRKAAESIGNIVNDIRVVIDKSYSTNVKFISFIEETIINRDYVNMENILKDIVDKSKQSHVNVKDINDMSTQINESVIEILSSIDEISKAIESATNEIINISSSVSSINTEVVSARNEVIDALKNSQEIDEHVRKFKVNE